MFSNASKHCTLLAFYLISLLAGCASAIKTDPVLSDGQEAIYRDGLPALVSHKKFVVLVSPLTVTREAKERLRFVVSVANTSSAPFDLDTSNFFASVDGRPLKVFTHEEIAQEIKKRQALAAFAVALGGSMQAQAAQQQASYSSTSGTYNGSTSGRFDIYGSNSNVAGNYNTNTTGTYSGWTYNPAAGQAAAAAVDARTSADLVRLQQQGQMALSEASQLMLKRTTVFPQTTYGGQIILGEFEVPASGNTLELTANVQGELHKFIFSQRQQQKQ